MATATTTTRPVKASTSIRSPSSIMCSQCSSMAHFSCMEHCQGVFCGKCSVKHRTAVMKEMDSLAKELRQCKIDPITTHDQIDTNFQRESQQALQRTQDTVRNLIAQLQERERAIKNEIKKGEEFRRRERERRTDSSLLTSEEAHDYTHLLNDCLRRDQLLDAETMKNIQTRLTARNALGQAASEAKHPIVEEGKFEVEKILSLRFAPRAQSVHSNTQRNRHGISVTVRLDKQKLFQSPLQGSFSVGRHPTAISLNDRYLETFFCRRTPGNSLILLSSTAIDVITRGSGVELSFRLSKILGTMKDKLLAGAWCERTQRLLLVGNHRIYAFDMQKQAHADRYRCEPAQGDPRNTPRFIGCANDGSVFYGYKSAKNRYTLAKYRSPPPCPKESGMTDYEDTRTFFDPKHSTMVEGRVAAMCVTHNRIALVFRRFETEQISKHYFTLFDHELKKNTTGDVELPADIKWITAITAYGNDDRYLFCDPRGQQLLLYHATGSVLSRRFRIGAINACCLTDGRLVLWLQKQYASSPTGKLHFITAPHLEEPANVAKSHALLAPK